MQVLRNECDELLLEVKEKQADFWTEMSKSQPAVAVLNSIGLEIETLSVKCEDNFQKQILLAPNSVQTLRNYAQFLMEVTNNTHLAAKINEQADDIEEIAENDSRATVASVEFLAPVRASVDRLHQEPVAAL